LTRRFRTGLVVAVLTVLLPSLAYADCANPAGVKGEFFYNDDHSVMQFCNGTNWIGMSGGSGGGGAGVTDGDKGDITVSGSGASWLIDDDALNFTEFSDTLALDASTDIAISGSQVLSLTNTGTGNSFVVNDQASDTTPFVIDASGNIGIGLAVPTQALDVVGKTTSNSFIVKPQTGLAAPTGGSTAQWTTDGTHVWRATGNVGIGTAAPGAAVHVLRALNQTNIDNSNQLLLLENTQADAAGLLSGLRFRFTNGTNASQAFVGLSSNGTTNRSSFIIASPNPSGNATERMRIDQNGNVGIGTTSPSYRLQVASPGSGPAFSIYVDGPTGASSYALVAIAGNAGSGGGVLGYTQDQTKYGILGYGNTYGVYSNGNVYISGTGGACVLNGTPGGACSSDLRLKADVDGIGSGMLQKIALLRGVTFRWKDTAKDQSRQMGLIAQDVEAVFPELVGDVEGSKSVQYGSLVVPLIEAVKELKADNDNLREDLSTLRTEVEALKAVR
jgi:hypothetical protein